MRANIKIQYQLQTLVARVLVLIALLGFNIAFAQVAPPKYSGVSFYVIAHQDDWQLFMGSNAFKDIRAFDHSTVQFASNKVVFIYTTAGNIHDDDDKKSCVCKDPYDTSSRLPYWKVREAGSKNSIHLAACRSGKVQGAGFPYAPNDEVTINGHTITRYRFKNTVSYYLRMKTGEYGYWTYFPNNQVNTVDNSSNYIDWADFVNTLYYIFKEEMTNDVKDSSAVFNFPDINMEVNPEDHNDHYLAGRAGLIAVRLLTKETNIAYQQNLFVDYYLSKLPENISLKNCQEKSSLIGAYCLSLLDYNAWAEFDDLYLEWTRRSYYRQVNSTTLPGTDYNCLLMDMDTLALKIYPNPANNITWLKFNQPLKSPVELRITTISGAMVFKENLNLDEQNNIPINTSGYQNGNYMAIIANDNGIIGQILFQVSHY